MTPSNKGHYIQCKDCIFKKETGRYPCSLSHKQIRGDIKYERDFKICLQKKQIQKGKQMLDNFKDVFGQEKEGGDVFSAEETTIPKPQAVQIEKDANSKAAKKQKLHPTMNKRTAYATAKKALSK